MKEFNVHCHVWMTTGHEFDDYFRWQGKPTCEDIENAMYAKSKMRGFNGLDDIESFEVTIESI